VDSTIQITNKYDTGERDIHILDVISITSEFTVMTFLIIEDPQPSLSFTLLRQSFGELRALIISIVQFGLSEKIGTGIELYL
jgi:hypothetical protein